MEQIRQELVSTVLLEVCVDSVLSAKNAQIGGASRVELCGELFSGGITPSYGLIKQVLQSVTIPVFVMIRPRAGDFCYSDDEFEIMRTDIQMCAQLHVPGVVFGILSPDGSVDQPRCRALVDLAHSHNMQCTFHRAFDMARDPLQALEDIIALNFDRILTSGQESSCLEGLDLLVELCAKSADRIVIMLGGGITPKNVRKLLCATNAREFHVSGRAEVPSEMTFRNNACFMGGQLRESEYARRVVDHVKVGQFLVQASNGQTR